MTRLIRPPALKAGDTIGIAAPASVFSREAFLRGIERIHDAGYRTFFTPGIFSEESYLAGPDARRAQEINSLFADEMVRAIFCARGGYGSQRILSAIDSEVVRRNPKIFMGYSDITALHGYFHKVCGLVTFHGPLVTELGGMERSAVEFLFRSFSGTGEWGDLPCEGIEILRGGEAEGAIVGGSLSVFSMLLGTPYEPETGGTILFFEDRGEKPYAVDRLFSHIALAGKFKGVNGVLLGRFVPPKGWDAGEESYGEEIKRIVLDAMRDFHFPIFRNFPAGHSGENICFPLGVRVRLDGDNRTVTVVERCFGEYARGRPVSDTRDRRS